MTHPPTLTRPTSLAELDERFKQIPSNDFEESSQQGMLFQPLPTDLMITPYAKCGTTWLQQIVYGLKTRGDMNFDDISRVVPWLEVAATLGIDLNAPQPGAFRAFKSHKDWHEIPKGGRYLVALRDPKDALVSNFRFMEGWMVEVGSVAIADYAHTNYMKNRAAGSYWHHLLSWWEQRHNENVLLLCYEQMKRDLPVAIRTIANFVQIDLDDELFEIVCQQSSLDFMLAHKDKFDDRMMREHFERIGMLPPGSDSAKVRQGQVGAHRSELPAEISAAMDTIWQEEIEAKLGFASYQELREALKEIGD